MSRYYEFNPAHFPGRRPTESAREYLRRSRQQRRQQQASKDEYDDYQQQSRAKQFDPLIPYWKRPENDPNRDQR